MEPYTTSAPKNHESDQGLVKILLDLPSYGINISLKTDQDKTDSDPNTRLKTQTYFINVFETYPRPAAGRGTVERHASETRNYVLIQSSVYYVYSHSYK